MVFHAGIVMTDPERALGTKDSSLKQEGATLVKNGPHNHQIAMDSHPKGLPLTIFCHLSPIKL